MKKPLIASLLSLIGALPESMAAPTDGTIPNQAYDPGEQWTFISTQMSSLHLNQPSVFNGYAILAGNAVHQVWDISNPYTPSYVAEMVSNHHDGGEAESHQVTYGRDAAGNYYLCTVSGRGIDIWDMTDTSNPTMVSELLLPNINYGDVAGGLWGVGWQGDYIFAGATDNGLYVIDASDPSAPELVTTIPRSRLGGVSVGPLFALGDLLVVTPPKGRNGIATLDISDPTKPFLLDAVTVGGTYIGGFYGTYAHMEGPLRCFDVVSDPRNITHFTSPINFPSEYLSFSNDHAFIGGLRGGTQGIWKYDISDLENPVFKGRVEGRNVAFDDQFSCPLGNLAIVADDSPFQGGYVGAVIAVHDTAPDTAGPTIKWMSLEDGSTNQSRSGQFGISFDEWIEFKSVDETTCILRPVGGSPVAGKWGCTYTTLTFAADDFLEPETTYEIVLPAGGVTDLVGNAIESTILSTFTTGTQLPESPSVVEINPSLLTELGEPSEFSVSSPDTDFVYEWEYDDGNFDSGPAVTHTYAEPGRYNVKYSIRANPESYFEAEDADLNGVLAQTTHGGYTGGGYGDFGGGQTAATRILWTIELDHPVTTDLIFRYASSTTRPLNLVVNGGPNIPFPGTGTGGFSSWVDWVAENISLVAGTNTIELRADAGSVGPNIDHLRADLTSSTPETALTLEAEEAALAGGIAIDDHWPGFTGTGYADYPGSQGAGIKTTWNLELAQSATLDLTFRYASSGTRPLNLVVNGGTPIGMPGESTGGFSNWADWTAENVALNAGSNTIELIADAGSVGPNIDHLRVLIPATGSPNPVISSFSFVHVVHRPLSTVQPSSSSSLVLDGGLVWCVCPDANTISAVDMETMTKAFEVPVGLEPKAIAEAPDGTLWVSCRKSSEIAIIDTTLEPPSVVDTIVMPHASRPMGLAFAPDDSAAFLTLQALGQLVKIDPSTHAILDTLDFGPDAQGITPQVRGLAINGESDTVYVTRFVSPDAGGEVYEVDAATMNLTSTIPLAKSTGVDESQFARGIPNYLTSITISPDGARAWVPSKKDNIDRGGARDGLPLDNEVTVRAITSSIDLTNGAEVLAERTDHDNGDRCHACAFSPYGDLAFVTMPGNNEVRVVDAYSGAGINTLLTEKTPEGIQLDAGSGKLYVLNFLSRSLSVFDVTAMLNGESSSEWLGDVPLLDSEPLSPEVLRGKEIFYDAESFAINASGYMSCASCHLDGSHDGRTYDFTAPMGEGFRNTTDLRGRSGTGHGRVHWSGNFDEIHDFEGQLRGLGAGLGLMSDSDFHAGTRSEPLGDPKAGRSADLDALAAYVSSLTQVPASPHRNPDGSLTSDAVLGKAHFENLQCFTCHGGESFTDSALGSLHDVGTLLPTSGQRLGGTLSGIDTPTLKGIWATAPYLHDGSAPTLRDVLTTKNPSDQHGAISTLNNAEIDQLVAYLQQIDEIEPAAQPVSGVGSSTYASFIQSHGLSGPDALEENDHDKDGWSNLAEFAWGATNPDGHNDFPQVVQRVSGEGADDFLQISWLRRDGGIWEGENYRWGKLTYSPLGTTDLESWDLDCIIIPNPAGLPPAPAGYLWTTSRLSDPVSALPRAFLRAQVLED